MSEMLNRLVLHIYDFLAQHHWWRVTILFLAIVLPALAALRLHFQEDIADFLPVSDEQKAQLASYQAQNGGDRVVVLFSMRDTAQVNPDRLCDAIEAFEKVVPNTQAEADISMLHRQIVASYQNLPYRITAADTARWDTLLTREYVYAQIAERRAQLQLPLAGSVAIGLTQDPLNLFGDVLSNVPNRFTSYQGYMFSKDEKLAFVFVPTDNGNTETKQNARLVDSLQAVVNTLSAQFEDVYIRLNGAPVIAVGNSRQIKKDSVIAITIALVLIILLLMRSLKNWRSMLLIVASTGYGVLFALGVIGLLHPNMSLIVLGVASVIVGIAVNYPLHVLVHRQYTTTVRQTLQEVVSPLIIGNITTVGAFLTLVPLRSVALRDLGIFCACLLLGTILFSVVFLPHFAFETPKFESFSRASKLIDRTSKWKPEKSRWLIAIFIILTVVFGWFGRQTTFDADLSHINFMTIQQRADIQTINNLVGDEPLSPQSFGSAQLWNTFWVSHRDKVSTWLHEALTENGFRETAFKDFEKRIEPKLEEPQQINIASLQSQITTSLIDNFNYIGLACSLVVFVFLWLSFRKLKYALTAFLPMVFAWIWILGIMQLTGIQFNIVNIILATFIFGQGDDYTIFITEGLLSDSSHQNAERLVQYKNSILLSALIMFIGIGALIVAHHPALHSLATVTILGMFTVVLMAYWVPPVVLKFFNLFSKNEQS